MIIFKSYYRSVWLESLLQLKEAGEMSALQTGCKWVLKLFGPFPATVSVRITRANLMPFWV